MSTNENTNTSPGSALGSAVLAVMSAVRYVQRGGEMRAGRGGGYRYLTERDLISAIRPAMINAGIVLLPVGVDAVTVEAGTARSGAVQWRTEGTWTWRLLHAESGESMDVRAVGLAVDGGDKGANQAQTHAYKNLLRGLFLVESGDEPGTTPSEDQEVVPREHSETFDRLRIWFCRSLTDNGIDPARYMDWTETLSGGDYGRPSTWGERALRGAVEAALQGRGPGGFDIPREVYRGS